jgi:hypothetical protein
VRKATDSTDTIVFTPDLRSTGWTCGYCWALVAVENRAAKAGGKDRGWRGSEEAQHLGGEVVAGLVGVGDLHRREPGVQTQHRALLAADLLLVVGVDEERERRAAGL